MIYHCITSVFLIYHDILWRYLLRNVIWCIVLIYSWYIAILILYHSWWYTLISCWYWHIIVIYQCNIIFVSRYFTDIADLYQFEILYIMQLFFQWYITFLIDISLIYQWYITDILNYINLKTFKWYIIDISSKNCDISSRQHLNDISSNRYINDISTYFYKDISARYMISQKCMIYLFIIFYHWYITWDIILFTEIYQNIGDIFVDIPWYIAILCWYIVIYQWYIIKIS